MANQRNPRRGKPTPKASGKMMLSSLPEGFEADGLKDEIAMLRVIIRQVAALAEEGRDLDELLKVLNTVSIASQRLALVLKTQLALGDGQNGLDLLNEKLNRAIQQYHIENKTIFADRFKRDSRGSSDEDR